MALQTNAYAKSNPTNKKLFYKNDPRNPPFVRFFSNSHAHAANEISPPISTPNANPLCASVLGNKAAPPCIRHMQSPKASERTKTSSKALRHKLRNGDSLIEHSPIRPQKLFSANHSPHKNQSPRAEAVNSPPSLFTFLTPFLHITRTPKKR